jgi:hypothetical protein
VSGPEAQRQPELRGRCSIVRELHVYGTAVAVHARDSSKFQHQVRELLVLGRLGSACACCCCCSPCVCLLIPQPHWPTFPSTYVRRSPTCKL